MTKLSQNKIEEHLCRFKEHDIDDEIIGIAVCLDEMGKPVHSGIVLCYENEKYFLHYTSKEVLLENVTDVDIDIYFKKLEIFSSIYLPYIRAHFDLLLETVNPKYGFVFAESFYDEFGTYVTEIENLPDFCTCVGFCINVIRGLMINNTKYIETADWNEETLERINENYVNFVDQYLKMVLKFSPEQLEKVKSVTYKRILPMEMLLSGFFAKIDKLPVRKIDIDSKILLARKVLKDKWISTGD